MDHHHNGSEFWEGVAIPPPIFYTFPVSMLSTPKTPQSRQLESRKCCQAQKTEPRGYIYQGAPRPITPQNEKEKMSEIRKKTQRLCRGPGLKSCCVP